ncbi:Alpha-D-ribose 1-methylphosphonate 5-triphosphate synthase subunit PhnI [Marinomonas spartinae]|uniref:Alpha-D-ribose 1-methylphosphonate 5-triphosphate synthase subunit PhnI n=1 Tax=Marinomonas spartinae TaxID=1792290 RepID=A0A1A8TM77_9GAMM|nr:carbon-phosphorus lyase complex subunit PhnI [Marinomonas spartinae]SBS34184.1 Alpha-D-ribose 1-methylphosphonate 5-triphosphate synthase subunit PhnI [Marinomonas spartinae]SBS37687.1 Alpha-D-ribose 1-methylphosphonate 5-triphosphate synthase subunit PhnI [Marinomonas spartinae]
MYVAVKGGETAINNAHKLLDKTRRGSLDIPELSVAQISEQLPLAVARVMTEGSIYDPQLAALAIKQSAGDLVEAIFLLRAYRTTLSRFYCSDPIDTTQMQVERRISATFKDLPGGQLLGSTFDYTHRLLDFTLLADGRTPEELETITSTNQEDDAEAMTRVLHMLERENLMVEEVDEQTTPTDITQDPPAYPCHRSARLQALARGDEGFLLALGYSTQRGYGRNHPFAGEIRTGDVTISITPDELGFSIDIGTLQVTECEMINGFSKLENDDIKFTRGYGLAFGQNERKTLSMALIDRALQAEKYGEERVSPAQQEEFILSHCDNVEAAGFVSHLKLPHYVDFQSELELLRRLRKERMDNEQQGTSGEQA